MAVVADYYLPHRSRLRRDLRAGAERRGEVHQRAARHALRFAHGDGRGSVRLHVVHHHTANQEGFPRPAITRIAVIAVIAGIALIAGIEIRITATSAVRRCAYAAFAWSIGTTFSLTGSGFFPAALRISELSSAPK